MIICLLFVIAVAGTVAENNYGQSAKIISSGASWSSNTNYLNFGVIGEPIVSHSIASSNMNGVMGFILSDKVQSVTAPQPPILIYPPDNNLLSHLPDSSLSITFYWMANSGERFNFQLSGSDDFSNLLHDTTISDNYLTVKIKNDGQFYWRVKVLRGNVVSEWSTVWKFYIIATDVEVENKLQIYPNPTENIIQVIVPEELTGGNFSLINLLGRKCFSVRNISLLNAYDVSKLQPGLYIITITKGKYKIIRKLVKQ